MVPLQGEQVTLSFYALAGANFSAASSNISVQAITGTAADQGSSSMIAGAWTSQASTLSTTQAITTSWTLYSFTFTMPSTAKECGIVISYTPVGTAGAADYIWLTGIQLEPGAYATSFERRAPTQEQLLAYRYYVLVPVNMQCPYAAAMGSQFQLPVPMRATPTLTNVTAGTFSSGSIYQEPIVGVTAFWVQFLSTSNGGYILGRVEALNAEL